MSKHHKLYSRHRWRRRRRLHLIAHPLCERCGAPATVVHHRERHQGDVNRFVLSALEALCKSCHDRDAQQQERRGYSTEIGADGLPTDPLHPAWNRPLPAVPRRATARGAIGCTRSSTTATG
jgi:5-methylcytosine-specific restriction enzyme A